MGMAYGRVHHGYGVQHGYGSTVDMGSTMRIGSTMGKGSTTRVNLRTKRLLNHQETGVFDAVKKKEASEGEEEENSLIDRCLRRR